MTQVSLDKLSKKNQEFVHIATHQLIKDGKTDEEIKALLEEIIPTILKSSKRNYRSRTLWSTYCLGSEFFRSKTKRSSNYQRKYQSVSHDYGCFLICL